MANNIIYKPHCGKCGALIDEDVSFRKIHMDSKNFKILHFESAEVYPYVCKECGTIFECIEIKEPKQLPTEHFN